MYDYTVTYYYGRANYELAKLTFTAPALTKRQLDQICEIIPTFERDDIYVTIYRNERFIGSISQFDDQIHFHRIVRFWEDSDNMKDTGAAYRRFVMR